MKEFSVPPRHPNVPDQIPPKNTKQWSIAREDLNIATIKFGPFSFSGFKSKKRKTKA